MRRAQIADTEHCLRLPFQNRGPDALVRKLIPKRSVLIRFREQVLGSQLLAKAQQLKRALRREHNQRVNGDKMREDRGGEQNLHFLAGQAAQTRFNDIACRPCKGDCSDLLQGIESLHKKQRVSACALIELLLLLIAQAASIRRADKKPRFLLVEILKDALAEKSVPSGVLIKREDIGRTAFSACADDPQIGVSHAAHQHGE